MPALTTWLRQHAPHARPLESAAIEVALAALKALPAGSRVVLIGGGGTVNRMLPALLKRGHALGLVPLGSGNDAARSFGVRGWHWQAALADAPAAPSSPVDVGALILRDRCGPFPSSPAVGFDAAVAGRAARAGLTAGSAARPVVNAGRVTGAAARADRPEPGRPPVSPGRRAARFGAQYADLRAAACRRCCTHATTTPGSICCWRAASAIWARCACCRTCWRARPASAESAASGVSDAAPRQRPGSAAGGRRRAAVGTTCVRGRGARRRAAGGAVSILKMTPAPRAKRALRAARPGGQGPQSLFLPLPWPLPWPLSLSLPLPLPLSYLT